MRDVRPDPERPKIAPALPQRSYEVAALRADGSLFIGQSSAPAIPFFEDAFSAFAAGSLVQTIYGAVAIEDLQPGDMIETQNGTPAELVWVGTATFSPADVGKRTALTRIMTDSFGQDRPDRPLSLGPGARILHTPAELRGGAQSGPLLTPARQLVDGVNVIEVTPPTSSRLFHLCLSRHAVIRVNGIDVESFHPGSRADQVSPSLRDRFLALFPRISEMADFGPPAHPRAPQDES